MIIGNGTRVEEKKDIIGGKVYAECVVRSVAFRKAEICGAKNREHTPHTIHHPPCTSRRTDKEEQKNDY